MHVIKRIGWAVAVLGLMAAGPARASVLVTATEVGGNVVFSGGGTIDLAGLAFDSNNTAQGFINPSIPEVVVGPLVNADVYRGFTSLPSDFGPGGDTAPASSTGDTFGVSSRFSPPLLGVLTGYVSGDPLNGTSTYAGATFASLGLTPGTYVWTWGSGANADSFTLQIGPAVVPEPSTLALAGIGGIVLAGYGRRLRRRRADA